MELKIEGQWPSFTKKEAKGVLDVLSSNKVNYWTGNEGKKFENEFSEYMGSKYSIALANGTLALELALEGIDVKRGDEIIVTPRSFIASVSSVIRFGAIPVFADIDPISGNISPQEIKKKITKKTKAVICVHLSGWPCEMDEIMDLSKKYNLYIIEDCAQAHGASYKGRKVGTIGHVGAWSFCQDKIMTTGGEGGMVSTNDEKIWNKMWSYKDHGKSFDAVHNRDHPEGFRWLHESFGSNYRITEMQAKLGRIQLKKLDIWIKKRNENALIFKKVCDKYPNLLSTPLCPDYSHNAYYKFYSYLKPQGLKDGWSRKNIIEEFSKKGIPCFEGSCSEIYLESAFNKKNFKPKKRLSNAKKLGENSLVFLVHPTLTKKDISFMKTSMDKIFREASI